MRAALSTLCVSLIVPIGAVSILTCSGDLAYAQATIQTPTGAPGHPGGTGVLPRGGDVSSEPSDPQGLRRLQVAQIYRDAGDWDKAADAFNQAAMSNNPDVARRGADGLIRVLREKDAAPLGLRARLPDPYSRWWLLDYAAYAVLAALLIGIGLPAWSWLSAKVLSPMLRAVAQRDPYRARWRLDLTGSAGEAERSAAFDEFIVTYCGLERDEPDGLSSVGPPNAKFFTPYSLADLVGPNLVVRGFDISKIADFLQKLVARFSYDLEIRVDTYQNNPYIFASLRWGGRQEKYWQIPVLGEKHLNCYREAGRQLAFSVFGDRLVRT